MEVKQLIYGPKRRNNTGGSKMMTSKQEAYRKSLIKRLHTVKSEIGLTDYQYRAVLSGFGVESSKQLSIDELLRAIELLQTRNPDDDKWRKRCMAVIGAYLRRLNYAENAESIKAVACRASGYENFNSIPVSRLRQVYYEFARRNNTSRQVGAEISRIEHELSNLN